MDFYPSVPALKSPETRIHLIELKSSINVVKKMLTQVTIICNWIPWMMPKTKAYIPLRRKKVALSPGVGLAPQRHYFALGILTCWYLKMLKFAFPPTQNPNASQWNIGCVGSLALGLCVGHVHFIFFVLISFALGSRRKRSFQWNMGLSVSPFSDHSYYSIFLPLCGHHYVEHTPRGYLKARCVCVCVRGGAPPGSSSHTNRTAAPL